MIGVKLVEEFIGRRWGDICESEKDMLLKHAVCRDLLLGCPLNEGEGVVEFAK